MLLCCIISYFALQSQIMFGEVQGLLRKLLPNAWQHQSLTQQMLGLMQQHTRLPNQNPTKREQLNTLHTAFLSLLFLQATNQMKYKVRARSLTAAWILWTISSAIKTISKINLLCWNENQLSKDYSSSSVLNQVRWHNAVNFQYLSINALIS